jgi:hypothetical protein
VCVWQCGQGFQALPTFFTCAAHGLRRFLCTSSPCPCLSTSDALVERCETAGLRASEHPVRPMRDGGNAPAARRRGHEVRWTALDPDHGTRRGWAAARSNVCTRQCGFRVRPPQNQGVVWFTKYNVKGNGNGLHSITDGKSLNSPVSIFSMISDYG